MCQDLNLQLNVGTLTALLGANGMGKSSLLRVMAGLQKPLSGEIWLASQPLGSYALIEKAKLISIVNTEKPQANRLTVAELVALGRYPHTNWAGQHTAQDQKQIEQAIALMQLQDLSHRLVTTLSDGQLQKTLLARALAQDGQLILLDEPTAHLDLPNKAQIWKLLQQIAQKEQKTIVVATHDVEFAVDVTNSLWLLHNGKLEVCKPTEIKQSELFQQIFGSQYLRFDDQTNKFFLV